MYKQGYKDYLTGEVYMADSVNPTNPYLVASYRNQCWQIYHTITGKPFLNIRFASKEDALAFGAKLHEWYAEYLWIWEDKGWCGKDIPMLVQYTIPNGERINEAIRWMETQAMVSNLHCLVGL